MKIGKIIVGEIKTNCYVIQGDKGEVAVVDPGGDYDKIFKVLEKIPDLKLRYILLTHGHYDHVLAVDELKNRYPKADIIIGEDDVEYLRNLPLQGAYVSRLLTRIKSEVVAVSNGAKLPFSETNINVIATPGHTPGGVCYSLNNNLFSGDTLFWHTCGRTDLPGGSNDKMTQSINQLLGLPQKTKLYPGHGQSSTIALERNFWQYNI